jgi:hypothetical protein
LIRGKQIVGAAIVISWLACAGAPALPATALWPDRTAKPTVLMEVAYSREKRHTEDHAIRIVPELPRDPLPELPLDQLSAQQLSVMRIADRNGDKTFIMVDKALGKILLFEAGAPVYTGDALTGESPADRMSSEEMNERFSTVEKVDNKVTPAGRFTVTRGYDKELGPVFDIDQVHGKDWGIAIHQVYLGIPSEHRAERLKSTDDDEKNITYGCINVARDTIRLLERELPKDGSVILYILPRDETKTPVYFPPGDL